MDVLDAAIVGAGPFGLSVAAWVGGSSRVFGEPMQTWRTVMPPDMTLRSRWEETSLSAPGAAGTLDAWAAATGRRKVEPVPLSAFLEYSDWFRDRFVPDLDPHDVVSIEPSAEAYRLTTSAGDEIEARRVVLAVGVTPFAHLPAPFEGALGDGVRLALGTYDFGEYRGRRVVVVGGGQGALETAALATEAGADVELVVRSKLHWFADHEPENPRGPLAQRLHRLAYPVLGYGPPPLNRLSLHPDLFAALPGRVRRAITRRMLRAGGSPHLRRRLEGRVGVTHAGVERVERKEGTGVTLTLSDGSRREVAAALVATGFRFSLDRLDFLAPSIRSRIAVEDDWPVLDRWFRSTDPNLFLVGYAAEGRFGPVSRFVLGADFAARRVHEVLRR